MKRIFLALCFLWLGQYCYAALSCRELSALEFQTGINYQLANNERAVWVIPALAAPALGDIITSIGVITGITAASSLSGDTKKKCGPCEPPPSAGTKVELEYHAPGTHTHAECTIDQGHWHYKIRNQNPQTCKCFNNKTSKTYLCGSKPPV